MEQSLTVALAPPSGVRQGMLETVVPKTESAAVMIVRGKKHRGQV